MKHLPVNRFIMGLIFLMMATACGTRAPQPATPLAASTLMDTTSEAPGEITIEQNITYGPGSFIYTDLKAGLSELSSYKVTLTLAFDGTRDGQAEKWSRTYVMTATKDPAARQWNIETTGDPANSSPVFLAEMDGLDYERRGEETCTATAIQEDDPLTGRLELASFLTGVIGAQVSGDETVNGVAAKRYFFDQQALGEQGLTEAKGDLWVAVEGNYIVKYLLTRKAKADYFGEGIEGTLTLDYELADPTQPVTVQLPKDCPPGMVDAPLLPDATNVTKGAGILSYETATSVADAVAFYQKQLPDLGWKAEGRPGIEDTAAFLEYKQDSQTMTLIINTTDSGTAVQILLENIQK